jgi:hypothetical protein
MASCGASGGADSTFTFCKNAFYGFLVTFEARPQGWNREEGYKFNEPDDCNPAIKYLKPATTTVATSQVEISANLSICLIRKESRINRGGLRPAHRTRRKISGLATLAWRAGVF